VPVTVAQDRRRRTVLRHRDERHVERFAALPDRARGGAIEQLLVARLLLLAQREPAEVGLEAAPSLGPSARAASRRALVGGADDLVELPDRASGQQSCHRTARGRRRPRLGRPAPGREPPSLR
jgi:hypothetical protein